MTETLAHHHPLSVRIGAGSTIRAVDHLEFLRRPAIVAVLARDDAAPVLAGLADMAEVSARFAAPGEWLAVSHSEPPENLLRMLSSRLGEAADIGDQSDGRVLMRLSGPNVRRILAKGVGVDLNPAVFATGASSNLLCGRIAVNLVRTGDNEFELIVARSLAEALFDDLMRMGCEFDLSYGFIG